MGMKWHHHGMYGESLNSLSLYHPEQKSKALSYYSEFVSVWKSIQTQVVKIEMKVAWENSKKKLININKSCNFVELKFGSFSTEIENKNYVKCQKVWSNEMILFNGKWHVWKLIRNKLSI